MSPAEQIKPIPDLKSNAAEQETLALLKLLNLGTMDHQDKKFQSADDFFAEMDAEE